MIVLLSGELCSLFGRILNVIIFLYHTQFIIFRNYHPETPVDDMKKDPSFDLEKERRRTRVGPKRSFDHSANTSASDDTVSSSFIAYIMYHSSSNTDILGCEKSVDELVIKRQYICYL